MTDEHRPRSHWTDERLSEKFAGIDKTISESRTATRGEIADLKRDFDDKHGQNQRSIQMLTGGQATIQTSLAEINEKQGKSLLLLSQIVGEDGKPEEGRLGKLEVTVETLKKFRWQLIAGASVVMSIVELLRK